MAGGLKNAKWWDSGEFRPKFTPITLEIEPPQSVSIQERTNLVLTTSPVRTSVNLGNSVDFVATLTIKGVAIVGEIVVLQESVDGIWTTIGTDTTDGFGKTQYTITPTQTTVYRAYFGGG